MSFDEATSMLTITVVTDNSEPSHALTANAGKIPKLLGAPFHLIVSPLASNVVPVTAATHVEPFHFSRVVPEVTVSILKLGSAVSTSASFATPAKSL